MKLRNHALKYISAFVASISISSTAIADVNVAYFLEWATPSQIAKVEKAYDKAIGDKLNWVNFATGTAMTEAMLAGDIDIAVSQGLTPFVSAINANAPIKMVAVAVAYSSADDCIIRKDSEITKENAQELEGKSIAVPLNTTADFGFRKTLEHLNVDITKVTVIDQEPADAAVSLVNNDVTMACGYGQNSLSKMKEVGAPILSKKDKEEAGFTSFDAITVTEKFAQERPDALKSFLKVTNQANIDFAKSQAKIDIIAKDAGMSLQKTKAQIDTFNFPLKDEQLTRYFGEKGKILEILPIMGKMFATVASPARSDYSSAIDDSFLKGTSN